MLLTHTYLWPLETMAASRHPLVPTVAEQSQGMALTTLPSGEGDFGNTSKWAFNRLMLVTVVTCNSQVIC